jgi:hypothetical protein
MIFDETLRGRIPLPRPLLQRLHRPPLNRERHGPLRGYSMSYQGNKLADCDEPVHMIPIAIV